MSIAEAPRVRARPGPGDRLYAWRAALLGSRRFQVRAARVPVAAGIARRDGERLFDLVAGFLHSQILLAFVQFDLPGLLARRPKRADDLALALSVPPDRMRVLCRAAAALGLLKRASGGRYALGRLGAALPGVPGLVDMIRHHGVLYRDMSDPAAFFRDGAATELAAFWPYVCGAEGPIDPETAARYSALMAESQALVAEEALRHLRLGDVGTLLDVGGGTGAFLAAVGAAWPGPKLHLLDLPAVAGPGMERFAEAGVAHRACVTGGKFRADALPAGADGGSLGRVLYDHGDDTVRTLLAKVHGLLPERGRVIVVEPMSGGAAPTRAGDAYFGLYCMAMGTGRARSAAEIGALLEGAGFSRIRAHRTRRPFITGLVEARKP